MEMLPDEVLLMVLEELGDARDILACRLVCKRLAALALHPAVWRDFYFGSTDPRCVCPVMRLVPCIDSIDAQLPEKGCRQWAYATTRCAAKSLRLRVDGAGQAVYAAAIISRHEALGRLIDVDIEIRATVVTDVTVLLGTLASTINLKKLFVYLNPEAEGTSTTAPILGGLVVTPSLREFDCNLVPLTERFVKSILSQHAATLEEVDLGGSASSLTCTSAAPLLAAVTNLTKLTCCCLPGMEALTACKSLEVLEITVHAESLNQPAVAGVAKLLRRAEQLREVSLEYAPAVRSLADFGAELVSALASSGRSRVETLRINNYRHDTDYVGDCPLPQLLVSALPSLSALRCLSLEIDGAQRDAFLLAIRPDLAPALQRVEVWVFDGCGHAWIHGDTVKAVLSVNPSLHLILDVLERVCKDDERCQACELDCHAELRVDRAGRTWSFPSVYSHDPLDECPEDHIGDSSELWIHLPF
ncbi:uncharacterized protein LOC113215177 isoform X2 [Frankliniella occidentalis]|uniref:Uncharacterized protein LOC113215177 isoform X2 n=1 Tax=Frankliniella occidentalis TaxID=133901 RepID=A0A9C6XSY6_FRAOC|nr:uncharacterized protein LOC113215177 isoform X2 [Frankliniella occidentalis]